MSERFDAVLFDAGGVLWDLRPSVEDVFAEALSEAGVRTERARLGEAMRKADRLLDDDLAKLDGTDESHFWRRYDGLVLDDLGVHQDADTFAAGLSSELRGVFMKTESWVPYPDAIPALEAVRGMGLKTGMVSNASELARRVLKNLDMERFFDVIVISEEVGVRKPDPRIFRIALNRVDTEPSRTMFLGDKPATDLAGATRAGITGVLVDRHGTFPDSGFTRIETLDGLVGLLE
jgi:putative hydrolase of the HAD superfamily